MAALDAVHASDLTESKNDSSEECDANNSNNVDELQQKTNEECDVLQSRHTSSLQAESEFNKHQKLLIRNLKSPTAEVCLYIQNGIV